MEKSLEEMTKWPRQSGLKVKKAKTEICLFYKNNVAPVEIKVCSSRVISKMAASKTTLKVVGIMFDTKMPWSPQVSQANKKAKIALNAVKLIRKFFFCRRNLFKS